MTLDAQHHTMQMLLWLQSFIMIVTGSLTASDTKSSGLWIVSQACRISPCVRKRHFGLRKEQRLALGGVDPTDSTTVPTSTMCLSFCALTKIIREAHR